MGIGIEAAVRTALTTSDRVAVVALIISVISAALAGWSLFYTHRQHQLRKDERHDARTPAFEAVIADRRSWHVLKVRLTTTWPLASIEVTLLTDGRYPQFSDSQDGVDPGASVPRRIATWAQEHPKQGRLTAGSPATWRIDLGDEETERPQRLHMRILAISEDGKETWPVSAYADVPRLPGRLVSF